MDSPIKLFIIYAREDSAYKDRVIKQLRPLKGLIEEWHDSHILAGERWDERINVQLRSADIILLLISDDFFDSEYIQNTEIKNAFSRYDLGEVVLMPVIVRECVWEVAKELSSLQALPDNGIAVSSWQNQDAALRSVAKGVQLKAEQIKVERAKKIAFAQHQREEAERQKILAEEKDRKELEAQRMAAQRSSEEEQHKRIVSEAAEHRSEAQRKEKQVWQATWTANTIEAYEDYLSKFQPDPLFKKEAWQEIKRIKSANEPSIWIKHKRYFLIGGVVSLIFLIGWIALSLFPPEKTPELGANKEKSSLINGNPNSSTLSESDQKPTDNQISSSPNEVENPSVEESSKPQITTIEKPSAYLSLDKMNVFYIGVDNPVTLLTNGISPSSVKLSASGVNVVSNGGGHFIVRASSPGESVLTISAPGFSQRLSYRVKRIPDPTPLLGAKHRSKQMANGEFRATGGIAAVLENFDFDAKCDVAGFEATYLPKRQDPISKQNSGARWNDDVQDLISKAKPGDAYFFDDIKCKCPGDAAARNLGGMAFKIK